MIVVAVDNIFAFSFRLGSTDRGECRMRFGTAAVVLALVCVGWVDICGYESFECVHKWPLMFPDNEQTSSNTISLCIRKIMRCMMFVTVHQVSAHSTRSLEFGGQKWNFDFGVRLY